MGRKTSGKRSRQPVDPAGPCLMVCRLVERKNAKDFDPFSFLSVCYCEEKFDRTAAPVPAPEPERLAINYLVTGEVQPVEMPVGKQAEAMVNTVGGLQQAAGCSVNVLNAELWIKAFDPSDGAGQRLELDSENVPLVRTGDGVQVRVLAGRYGDTPGAVFEHPAGTVLFDVTLSEGAVFEYQAPLENTTFVYVFAGKVQFGRKGRKRFGKNSLLRISGGEIFAATYCSGARFLLISGRPADREKAAICPQEEKKICRVNGK